MRVLCLSCARLDAVPFGPWLSVWGYGKTNFRIVYLPEMDVAVTDPDGLHPAMGFGWDYAEFIELCDETRCLRQPG